MHNSGWSSDATICWKIHLMLEKEIYPLRLTGNIHGWMNSLNSLIMRGCIFPQNWTCTGNINWVKNTRESYETTVCKNSKRKTQLLTKWQPQDSICLVWTISHLGIKAKMQVHEWFTLWCLINLVLVWFWNNFLGQ